MITGWKLLIVKRAKSEIGATIIQINVYKKKQKNNHWQRTSLYVVKSNFSKSAISWNSKSIFDDHYVFNEISGSNFHCRALYGNLVSRVCT